MSIPRAMQEAYRKCWEDAFEKYGKPDPSAGGLTPEEQTFAQESFTVIGRKLGIERRALEERMKVHGSVGTTLKVSAEELAEYKAGLPIVDRLNERITDDSLWPEEKETPVATKPQQYILERDGERDIQFNGVKLAGIESESRQNEQRQRWTSIDIYRSEGDKLIAHVTGHTSHAKEYNRYKAFICNTDEELVRALKQDNGGWLGSLSKDVLLDAGISFVEEIA